MDILFREKYSYKVSDSLETTKMKLESLFNRKWYDLSNNVSGRIDTNGAFSFKSRYAVISLVNGQMIYLKGNLIEDGESTAIKVTLSPNIFLVLTLYLLPLISLNVLFGDNSLMGGSRVNNLIVLSITELFIFTIVKINSILLRRKFERVMGLNRPPFLPG